jgi:Ca-activated chloride channel family protein
MTARLALAAIFAAVLAPAAVAQRPSFTAGVDAVQVDVAVTRGGKPVANLVAENFIVTDNGARQDATVVLRSDLPLRVVMTLDTSESVKGRRLQQLVEASAALNDRLREGDEVSVITFSESVRLRAPMAPPGPHVREALGGLSGTGPTALFDALNLAFASEADQKIRSLVLLFSDGRDTSSWMPLEPLMETARRASSVLHVVRFSPDKVLDKLAEAAGGRTFSSGSDEDMQDLFTRALDEMRSRYVLTYTATGEQKKGWHDIRVQLRNARGDVSARPGYFVP